MGSIMGCALSIDLQAKYTSKPALASSCAVTDPMPVFAPLTIATFNLLFSNEEIPCGGNLVMI